MIFLYIVTILIALTFLYLWLKERWSYANIRIGKRGGSILALEIPFNKDLKLLENILNNIQTYSEFKRFVVTSGVSDSLTEKNPSERQSSVQKVGENENLKIYDRFNDLSYLFLNEEAEESKVLLTHDLIANSAQIPDREILQQNGFIVTVIQQSNLIIVVGIRGEFEKVLFFICEYLFSKGKKVLINRM